MIGTTKRTERRAVFCLGVFFVIVLLALATAVPDPTPFQHTVFRIVLSIAVAGTAAFLPGFMDVKVGRWLRAGGTMAVFAIVYFFNPAGLLSNVADVPSPTDPFAIHVFEPTPNGETLAHRFTLPFSDISKSARLSDFKRILRQLPGTEYSADTHKIIRIRDEVVLGRDSAETAVSRNNLGVLVVPNSFLDMFDSEHEAVTYLLGFVRDME